MKNKVCCSDRKPLLIMVWIYAGISILSYLLFPVAPYFLLCSVLGAHGIYYLFLLLLMTRDIPPTIPVSAINAILILAIVALAVSFIVFLVMAIRGKYSPFGYFCIINTAISAIVLLAGSLFGGSELTNGNIVPFLLLELAGNTVFCYIYFSKLQQKQD